MDKIGTQGRGGRRATRKEAEGEGRRGDRGRVKGMRGVTLRKKPRI